MNKNPGPYIALWLVCEYVRADVIRQLRINQGKCYRYGYELQGTPTGDCPECGASRRVK